MLLPPLPTCLPIDIAQGADLDVLARTWYNDVPGLGWVLELPVVTLSADPLPAIFFKALDDLSAVNCVFIHTRRR